MKVVKFCLLPVVALLLIGALAAYYFIKDLPTEWNVDVSTTIEAPAAEIHAYIDDLRRWPEWSAFQEEYPEGSYSFEGAERGVGAIMSTSMGSGSMRVEITASDPAKGVWFDELLEGKIQSKGVILFEERDGRTTVRWQDHGSLGDGFFLRPLNYFLQEGLNEAFLLNLESLKALVEAAD